MVRNGPVTVLVTLCVSVTQKVGPLRHKAQLTLHDLSQRFYFLILQVFLWKIEKKKLTKQFLLSPR